MPSHCCSLVAVGVGGFYCVGMLGLRSRVWVGRVLMFLNEWLLILHDDTAANPDHSVSVGYVGCVLAVSVHE